MGYFIDLFYCFDRTFCGTVTMDVHELTMVFIKLNVNSSTSHVSFPMNNWQHFQLPNVLIMTTVMTTYTTNINTITRGTHKYCCQNVKCLQFMQHQRSETARREEEAEGKIRSLSLSLRNKNRPAVRVFGVTSNACQSCSWNSEKRNRKYLNLNLSKREWNKNFYQSIFSVVTVI